MDLVFVDANVLYSKTLRDWALMLSEHCTRFAVVTSQDCIIEALANFRETHRTADGGVIRQIKASIEGALHDIISDWPGGEVPGMPDEKDWHVVNAATHAGVKILVTENMKDFAPIADAVPFDLYSADELFMLVADNDPSAVEEVVRQQVDYWSEVKKKRAAKGDPAPKGLSEALRDAGAPQFADFVRTTLRKLSGIRDDGAALTDSPTLTASTEDGSDAASSQLTFR
ncbi:PIN domain-containing protein [Leifsonia sp. EB34]|uniref:PIN domain-containing protein n=1 Tax=Leifsonia sp. EB34 TaxID=3156303 RepID=UPI003516A94B